MGSRTALYSQHLDAGARLVDFAGWDMPLHYGSQLDEHHAVRQHAGLFDVSHMTLVDVAGADAEAFLRRVLANDVRKLDAPGKAQYTLLLNPAGGVVDDLICYRMPHGFRLVVNSATRAGDLDWLQQHREGFEATLRERTDLVMLALQGPETPRYLQSVLGDAADPALALKPFQAAMQGERQWCRTGYTGEDGFELIVPDDEAADLWQRLLVAGVRPCGLGARDTLRLEAGMNLYGADMDSTTSPWQSNLGWTLDFTDTARTFIGKEAVEAERAEGPSSKLVGLVLEDKGVLRSHQAVDCGSAGMGEITSGGFSPTLKRSIALARVPVASTGTVQVQIRKKWLAASIVKPPFVRNGASRLSL